MKTSANVKFILFVLCILFSMSYLGAQSVLFQEDFEGLPVTSISNSGDVILIIGNSPCGKASRGNSANFNSTNVDFQNAQNGTYYLGVNPESPCGGFYWANNISTGTLDFSGATDSIVFKCTYFRSTTLGWGASNIEIIFSNGTTTDTVKNIFTTNDNWANVSAKLAASMMSSTVTMKINMGGGEGVALDNIEILGYSGGVTGITTITNNPIEIYPNPTKDMISWNSNLETPVLFVELYTLSGQKVQSIRSQKTSIDLSELPVGVYVLDMTLENGEVYRTKVLKE